MLVKCDDQLGMSRHPSGGFRRSMLQRPLLAGPPVIGPLRACRLIGAEKDDLAPPGRRKFKVDASQICRFRRSETREVQAGKERVQGGRELGDVGEQDPGLSGADKHPRVDGPAAWIGDT